jgi:hypothetical protein
MKPSSEIVDSEVDVNMGFDSNLRRAPCKEYEVFTSALENLIVIPRAKWSADELNIADFWDRRVANQHPRTSVASLAELHEMYPHTRPRDFSKLWHTTSPVGNE